MILISKYLLFQALQVNAVSEYFHYLFTTLVSYLIQLCRNFIKTDACRFKYQISTLKIKDVIIMSETC